MPFRTRSAALPPMLVRLARVAGGASLAFILVATLTPVSARNQIVADPLCLLCGTHGLANLVRNVVLFLPLGVAGGFLSRHPLRVWLLALLLTGFVEAAQLFIPGRNTYLADFLANGTGAGLGVLLGRSVRRRLLDPAGAAGWLLRPSLWLAGAAGALTLTAPLYSLGPPDPPHFVQWTPDRGNLERYRGSVERATLEGRPLGPGRHPDPEWLEAELLDGGSLELHLIAGAPPGSAAPILGVVNAHGEEVFLLSAAGTDLSIRLPYRASRLRLDQPDLVARGALDGIEEGDPVRIVIRRDGSRTCVIVNGGERHDLAASPGEAWGFMMFPAGLPLGVRWAFGAGWLMILALPSGLLARDGRHALLYGGLLAGVGMALAVVPGNTMGLPLGELMVLLLGPVVGQGLGNAIGQPDPEGSVASTPQLSRIRHGAS